MSDDEAEKKACYYNSCGVHARYVCGECEKPICTAHAEKGTDGKTYCPTHIGPHLPSS